jgi:glycine C-acetyltransferase
LETEPHDPLGYLGAEISTLKSQGLFRTLPVLEGPPRARSRINGREVINLSSNNYLGLCDDPRLKEAAIRATESHGVGSGAVRTIIGTQDLHLELEAKLAEFKKSEAVLVFQSGFAANAGTVSTILGRQDHIVSDRLNHASIIDGARLSRAKIHIYEHSDMDSLREKLAEAQAEAKESEGRVLVITDGVFSMDGDIARLPEIVELAEEYEAIMQVDDAHASGVLGSNGRGTVDYFGLHGRVDVQVGTLSKAVGVLGGYVAGSRALIDFLVHRARPLLFSTSHPPAVTASCIAAVDILLSEPEIIERLWENTRFFKEGLTSLGFDTGASETPITPVIVGEGARAMELSDKLFEAGVFAQGIAFPTVPRDSARVRAMVMATHTKEDLGYALEAFERVGKQMTLIP